MPLGTQYDERNFVEELGLQFARMGQPRMMGRMLAWLLVCEPPEQPAAAIGRALKASKATVSTMSRALQSQGLVERVAVPGDRRAHLRARPQGWAALVRAELRPLIEMSAILERASAHTATAVPTRAAALREIHGLHAFLAEELPGLLTRWEARKGASC